MITINQRPMEWPLAVSPLSGTTVHVWNAELRVLEQRFAQLAVLLSDEEQRRAQAYKIPTHQRRFRMVRGALRSLLGAYLHCDPAGIQLTQGPEGKPALAAVATPPLHFNVSHSRGLAVFSFCAQAEVGVDVEYIDASVDAEVVVNTAFSHSERARYRAARAEQRLQSFFRLWTQKEARIKAQGLAVAHLYFKSAEQLPVIDLPLGEQYVGAVALCNHASGRRDARQHRSER